MYSHRKLAAFLISAADTAYEVFMAHGEGDTFNTAIDGYAWYFDNCIVPGMKMNGGWDAFAQYFEDEE